MYSLRINPSHIVIHSTWHKAVPDAAENITPPITWYTYYHFILWCAHTYFGDAYDLAVISFALLRTSRDTVDLTHEITHLSPENGGNGCIYARDQTQSRDKPHEQTSHPFL